MSSVLSFLYAYLSITRHTRFASQRYQWHRVSDCIEGRNVFFNLPYMDSVKIQTLANVLKFPQYI
jgi:hypothetical protein